MLVGRSQDEEGVGVGMGAGLDVESAVLEVATDMEVEFGRSHGLEREIDAVGEKAAVGLGRAGWSFLRLGLIEIQEP